MATTAPFGTWKSSISEEAVTAKSTSFSGVRVSVFSHMFPTISQPLTTIKPNNGKIFLSESRSDGTVTIQQISPIGPIKDILPEQYNVRSTVHEYGGAAWAIAPSGKIVFVNASDQKIYIVDPNSRDIQKVTEKKNCRFASFNVHPLEERWILAIQEDHTHDTPATVVNSLVVIDSKTGNVKEVVCGADFFTTPQFSPDGKRFSWMQWNHPEMPWTGAELYWSNFVENDKADPNWLAGSTKQSISEPKWNSNGSLFFLQEKANYREIMQWKHPTEEPSSIRLDGLREAEFGGAEFILGSNTYALLSTRTMVAAYTQYGRNSLIEIEIDTGKWKKLDLPIVSVVFDALARLSDSSFLVIGGTDSSPIALYQVDLEPTFSYKKLRNSSDERFSDGSFSPPEHVYCSPINGSKDGGTHGYFYPPHNPAYKSPEGARPPLIILSHGGPTGHFSPGLLLALQYWTSRGFAFLCLNYRGSSGHGRQYRESLNTNWGLFEPEDAVNAISHLDQSGKIDGTRVGIQGGSAGGYCVLQGITLYPKAFAGAVSLYGVSELGALIRETHKFESQYMDGLLFRPNQTEEEKEAIIKDRSALTHVDKIESPLLLLHGNEDKVVPLEQAELIRDAMRARNRDVKLVIFEGEGHGFRNSKNMVRTLEEEMEWWQKTLVQQ